MATLPTVSTALPAHAWQKHSAGPGRQPRPRIYSEAENASDTGVITC